jgi:hypothetical protein
MSCTLYSRVFQEHQILVDQFRILLIFYDNLFLIEVIFMSLNLNSESLTFGLNGEISSLDRSFYH